jgi:hypothetical protein
VEGFDMPLRISFDGKTFQSVYPKTQWQTLAVPGDSLKTLVVDKNFYIQIKQQDVIKKPE